MDGRLKEDLCISTLTTKNGLASDVTKFIFQDSKDVYWIGYDNGFQKFDGQNFTTKP